jgi:predicted nucleotidyltransferase
MQIVTLKERSERERKRRHVAADAIMRALRDYARLNGGRFIVYGSVARSEMRDDSDIDILIDFPPETDRAAWSFAEDVCRHHRMPADIQPRNWVSPEFFDRISADSKVLS